MITPRSLGFRLPAEWETHRATWLCWPREEGISFEGGFEGIEELWAKLAKELQQGEEVHIYFFSFKERQRAVERLSKDGQKGERERIFLHDFPAYEPWSRDHGPIFLVGPKGKAVVDWGFNAWGQKYPPWDLDDAVPVKIAEYRKLPLFQAPMVLEGGAIDTDGQKTLLASYSSILDPKRNPGLSQEEAEGILREFLGVESIIWLSGRLEGDDTDGHVDTLARFVAPKTVLACLPEDPQDPNYAVCKENWERLCRSRTASGHSLEVLPLPTPDPLWDQGEVLPASYANFYIANRSVLVPSFGFSREERVKELLGRFFPERRILLWDARRVIRGLGAFHCITLQEPW
jgi:agmatine deiminase